MNEVVRFLEENPVQYLATTDAEGNPRVRPFQFMLEDGGRLFFCTSNRKEVFKQLKANPNVELCISSPDNTWIRVRGKAVFASDRGIKAEIVERSPLVKSIYETGDNPAFETFYLAGAEAIVADLSGRPPRRFRM